MVGKSNKNRKIGNKFTFFLPIAIALAAILSPSMAGARWYDPERGRFISRDPFDVDGPNPYPFSRNNPSLFVDPTGNMSCRVDTKLPSPEDYAKSLGVEYVQGMTMEMIAYAAMDSVNLRATREVCSGIDNGSIKNKCDIEYDCWRRCTIYGVDTGLSFGAYLELAIKNCEKVCIKDATEHLEKKQRDQSRRR